MKPDDFIILTISITDLQLMLNIFFKVFTDPGEKTFEMSCENARGALLFIVV